MDVSLMGYTYLRYSYGKPDFARTNALSYLRFCSLLPFFEANVFRVALLEKHTVKVTIRSELSADNRKKLAKVCLRTYADSVYAINKLIAANAMSSRQFA